MKKNGVVNPAFEPPSPTTHGAERRPSAGPREVPTSPTFDESEGQCGWGWFVPAALQCCNSAKGFLCFYSLLSVFQGIVVNGLVNVSISTIEKRYELRSTLTGVISTGYDISFCVLCLFVSFFGERGHKPRWLALASFLIGLGSLVFSFPHFFSGKYTYGEKLDETCPAPLNEGLNATCTTGSRSSLSNYFYVFLLGQLLMGAGGTPLYTLGTAFIDDSVPKHTASVYIGIGYSMALLGPAIGYVLGGQLLNIYVDFNHHISLYIDPEDPRWVGAWWISFVVCCFCVWLLIVPFSYFPKHLPGTSKIKAEKISEAHHSGSDRNKEYGDLGKSMKDFPMTLWRLLRNPVLMCLVIGSALESSVATSFATFLPKFIEQQFGYTPSYSATLAGLVLIPGAAIGQIISGVIVSRFKLSCKNIIKFIIATCTVAFVLNMVFLFANCGNEPFAGVSETYNGTGTFSNLIAPCNADCKCMRSYYSPVCGTDEVQYFSPCFAGCRGSVVKLPHRNVKAYSNCSCIVNEKIQIANLTQGATVGKCPSKCSALPVFLGVFFFAVVSTFMAVTPTTVAIFRCVPERHRAFAMGVQMLFVRILGTIPGPILYGVAIDYTCTLWSIDKCGDRGSCWIYNNRMMAYMLVGLSATAKVISILFNVAAFFLYNPPPTQSAEKIATSEKKDETETSVYL
ncbi:solute carrier organic anion transporter family member 4C1-like [Hemicordylus capensis]|uniref:solute carrier organic anion transporter family member 4C1-like n=1 Tax=Hemicordylus capensis TaxID=884348 RepID=UPI0023043C9D|nr:solute carrier organic anion transporter family member 4C1-like [Hemicordylus capensis]